MRHRLVSQIYLSGLLLVAALLAFAGNLNSYFLSDDFVQIGKVLHGDFSVTWGQAHGGFFRPLFILSYIVDSRVWHARPFGYHLTNITLHALNSFLVFQVARRLLQKLALPARTANAVAIAAAALFLLHPSHSEAVTWISGRADLLATCFCLASLWCYCSYLAQRRAVNMILALGFGALALLAKESVICLPFLILAVGLYHSRTREALVGLGGFSALLIVFLLTRAFFVGSFIGGYGAGQHLNFSWGWIRDRLLEAAVRSVLPAFPEAWSIFLFKPLRSPLFIGIALAAAGLAVILIVIRRKRYGTAERKTQNRFLLLLVSLFLVSLLPAINLKLNLYNSLGERFLYLPTVFSCLLVSYLSIIFIRRPKIWVAILVCVLAFYTWRLYQANLVWREAAQITALINQQLAGSGSPTRLAILNAPDNLRGVPVFHNGLPEMLQFFQHERPPERVEITAFQSLQSRWDEVDFQTNNETLVLETRAGAPALTRASSSECLEVISQSGTGLQIRPRPCSGLTNIYVFSGGQMRRVFIAGHSQ